MVSDSWEALKIKRQHPLSASKLPNFLQEENHLPRTVSPACTTWPPQKSVMLGELLLVLLLRTPKITVAESTAFCGVSNMRRVVF